MEDNEKLPSVGPPEQPTQSFQIVSIVGGSPMAASPESGPAPPRAPESVGRWKAHVPLDPRNFPHQERRSGIIPCTISNVECLITNYVIKCRYDVIRKKTMIELPGWEGSPDNMDNVAMAIIVSLAEANNMQRSGIEEQVLAIGDRNMFNPAAEWIGSKPWDGEDRLPAFYQTLTTEDEFPTDLKDVLMRKWLVSIVAATFMPRNFKARGVLTLQGEQPHA